MKEEVYEKMAGYIDAMADKLDVAASHVYEVLAKQQIISGVTDLVVSSIVFILCMTVIVLAINTVIKAEWKKDYIVDKPLNKHARILALGDELLFPIITGMAILAALASFFFVVGSTKQLINPEYYVIKELLDTF